MATGYGLGMGLEFTRGDKIFCTVVFVAASVGFVVWGCQTEQRTIEYAPDVEGAAELAPTDSWQRAGWRVVNTEHTRQGYHTIVTVTLERSNWARVLP